MRDYFKKLEEYFNSPEGKEYLEFDIQKELLKCAKKEIDSATDYRKMMEKYEQAKKK